MNKKTFADRLKEDRRLVLLRLLNEQPGKQANSSTLHVGLQFVHIVAERHQLIEDLRFLQLHQLVELEHLGDVNPDLYGVKLRSRGMDVVAGLIEIEGISPARRP
ncbi:MAG TPA: ArsR family transcriptional regulator [Pseudoxanthomonas sp.]|nr:ArsR family transcriptional regulator [Pseudoxanthomonas sp.]